MHFLGFVQLLILGSMPMVESFVTPQHSSLVFESSISKYGLDSKIEKFRQRKKTHLLESTSSASPDKKINFKIDLDSPKVATQDTLSSLKGENKKVYCRCWQSDTFPLCDGSHVSHNKEKGDNVGPLILSVEGNSNQDIEDNLSSDKESAVVVSSDDKPSFIGRLKSVLGFGNADGLTTKERMAKMGMSMFLSYGWVSNMSYAVTVSISWYIFSKKTGVSPLAPGQWKPFLAVYAGFYVFNNIIRPVRFGAAAVVSKYFDNFIAFIQRKTKLPRKWSIFVVVLLGNVIGTFTAMGIGISLASAAAGVPVFPPKA